MEYKRLKSTPGMWIIFAVLLSITVACSILIINSWILENSGESLPTKVFTVEEDVVSLKLPDDWMLLSSSTKKSITFQSKDGYESLSITKCSETNVQDASIFYMLELKDMFPDVSGEQLQYSEIEYGGSKMFATQILYNNQYYLCGVKESGNTIIRFVYSASIMAGEIADIDSIVKSINYREKTQKDKIV